MRRFLSLLLPATLGTFAPAQALTESPADSFPRVTALAGGPAFDPARQRCTSIEWTTSLPRRRWDWDGARWRLIPGESPPALNGDLVLDDVRQHLLLLDRSTLAVQEWDGTNWSPSIAAPQPAATGTFAIAFDSRRGRLVCVGASVLEWDGSRWWTSAPAPTNPRNVALAYDRARQRVVLFGGDVTGSPRNDTWVYDGSNWTLLATAAAPSPRSSAAMQWDPRSNQLLLCGGHNGTTVLGETWMLGPLGWQQLQPAHDPGPHDAARLVHDGVGMVLIGDDMWRWDGVDWSLLRAGRPGASTAQWNMASFAFQWHAAHNEAVLLIGDNNTGFRGEFWAWNGEWRQLRPAFAPPPRRYFACAEDAARGDLVLFGGLSTQLLGDTWTWDGTAWTQRLPANSPPPRAFAAMAPDRANNGVLLFGGSSIVSFFSDQWHWDGTNWTQRNVAGPSSRSGAVAAVDENTGHVVMFGGSSAGNFISTETWDWNGARWTSVGSVTTPALNTAFVHDMTFDRERGSLLLLTSAGLFRRSGTNWLAAGSLAQIGANDRLMSDPSRGWTLRYPATIDNQLARIVAAPAGTDHYGNGCALGPAPSLHALAMPRLGEAGFGLELFAMTPSAPVLFVLGLAQQNANLGSGCALLVDQTFAPIAAAAGAAGRSAVSLPIPALPALRGVAVYAQAAAVDVPRSLLLGLTITDGLRITIGD